MVNKSCCSTTAGSCYCHMFKFIGFDRIKAQMSNMIKKQQNITRFPMGEYLNNVVLNLLVDNGNHRTIRLNNH